ncbi:MAG: phosphoribosylanthranilate isomerase [Terriglobales bacterium]|jgi:phosphoribosylanthranilate isomerase
MTWVKICGITNIEDALTAVNAGADALGFVFYEKSPRYVTPEAVRGIVREVPAKIEKVGVFVDETLEQMEHAAETIGLTGVQMHAMHPRPEARRSSTSKTAKYLVLRADLLGDENGFDSFTRPPGMQTIISAIFLDAGSNSQPGGTGKTFDWQKAALMARTLQQNFRIVVAGGLTPTNVTEAMRILKPWGVDVSSGVEARPGKKDPERVRAFVAAVRNTDQEA